MNALATEPAIRGDNPRALALRILTQVVEQGRSLSPLLESELESLLQERDRRFCAELCYGVCRYYHVLNASLAKLIKKPLKSRDGNIALIILLGLYQIRFMRVEDHAAVNETVKMLALIKKPWARGLVNGVLRNYLRSYQPVTSVSADLLSQEEHLQAYPGWIRQRIEQEWPQQADTVISAGNVPASLALRVNTRRLSREQYLLQLAEHSIAAKAHDWVDTAILLEQSVSVEGLPGFDQALVSVQDAAAQIAASLLDCKPGMSVLDACAAPGGKTLHLLQQCDDLEMTALDKDASRLHKVQQNLDRAGQAARLVAADAARPQDWYRGEPFDRILLDAPCSASGIIRRHPDIRLLRKPSDIPDLVSRQQQLLNAMWPLLKPGGLMVYSTCSIFKDENEGQIEQFRQHHGSCVERPINTVQWGQARNPGRQILPGFHDMDGFYYACLEKPH